MKPAVSGSPRALEWASVELPVQAFVNYRPLMDRLVRLWELLAPPLVPEGLPDLVPALLLILSGAALVAVISGDRIGVGVLRAYGWLVCLMVPVAYTLTAAAGPGVLGCELGVLPWESRGALISSETTSNILLFVPAGAATILFPSGSRRLAALTTALAVPVLIEFGQMVTRLLGRACQVSDVVNNQMGVMLGFWLASGLWVAWSSLRGSVAQPATATGYAAPNWSVRPSHAPEAPGDSSPADPIDFDADQG